MAAFHSDNRQQRRVFSTPFGDLCGLNDVYKLVSRGLDPYEAVNLIAEHFARPDEEHFKEVNRARATYKRNYSLPQPKEEEQPKC